MHAYMNTIVFDIETIPQNFDSLEESTKEYLLRYAETPEAKDEIKEQMALWAPTNEIVAIGVVSVEGNKGAVYFQDNGTGVEDHEEEQVTYRAGTEAEILSHFWEVIARADRFVTFNGRGFDCPVLMLRSAAHGIRPSKNLMPYRFSTEAHIDLYDQLTFHGATRKSFNLDMYCKLFEVESPKSHGVSGKDVKPLYDKGRYMEIARYCIGDVFATRQLFLKWNTLINV